MVKFKHSNEKNFEDIFDYIKKNINICLLNLFFIFLSYGTLIFYYKIGIDSERSSIMYDKIFDGAAWINQGRFGIVFLKNIFNTGIITVPVFNYILAFICLNITLLLINYILDRYNYNCKNRILTNLAFNIFFITSTQLSTWLTFTMYAFEMSIGYLTTVLAVFYISEYNIYGSDCKKNLWKSIIFLLLATSIYQSFVTLYVSIILFILIIRINNDKLRDDFNLIYISGLSAFISIVLYMVINKILSGVFIAESEGYIGGFIGWKKADLINSFFSVARSIGGILSGSSLYGGQIIGLIYIIAIIILIYLFLKYRDFKKIIYILILLIAPFILSLVFLSAQPIRSFVALPFVCGAVVYLAMNEMKKLYKFKFLGIICVCIVGINISVYPAKLNYGDFIRYNQDVNLANKISEKINELNLGEYPEYPVVFIGYNSSNDENYVIKNEVIGSSIFEWDMGNIVRQNYFMKTLGYTYIFPSNEEVQLGYEISKNMEIFPNEGSVVFKDKVIVVKLSNPTEYSYIWNFVNKD